MFRINAGREYLDVDALAFNVALAMARTVRPGALALLNDNARAGDSLLQGDDTILREGDLVAHWNHPDETGRITGTKDTPMGHVHHVQWPCGPSISYLNVSGCLIRVTPKETAP